MNLLAILDVGFREIWAHRFRSMLSMFGVVLGVSSLISTFSLTAGMERGFRTLMREYGGLEMVTVGKKEVSNKMLDFWNLSPGITAGDVKILQEAAPLVSRVSPELRLGAAVSGAGSEVERFLILGVLPDFLNVGQHEVEYGRFLSDLDVERAHRCVVMGQGAIERLWGERDPETVLGETLFINQLPFTVVGIFKYYERESDAFARKQGRKPSSRRWDALRGKNETFVIPINTMFHDFKSGQFPEDSPDTVRLDALRFQIGDLDFFEATLQQARNALNVTHRGVDDFELETRQEWYDRSERQIQATRISGGLLAGISLIVGGIGIANVMLASITERVREIGIRRAVGATQRDIFLQIMIESVIIALIGGLVGIATSFGLLQLILRISPQDNEPVVQLSSVLISVGFAVVSGFLSGMYPAIRAARLDPIQALRYE